MTRRRAAASTRRRNLTTSACSPASAWPSMSATGSVAGTSSRPSSAFVLNGAAADLLRQRQRIRQHRHGSVGIHEQGYPRLQSARQADGQRAIESFNGRFREECLNIHWFASLEEAQQKIDAFRWDYNENHPHRALKGLSPREYGQRAPSAGAHCLAC
jgi:transposase InsO family protein